MRLGQVESRGAVVPGDPEGVEVEPRRRPLSRDPLDREGGGIEGVDLASQPTDQPEFETDVVSDAK